MLLSPLDRQASEKELISQALRRMRSSPRYRVYLLAISITACLLLVWLLFLRSDETTLLVRLVEASLICGLNGELIYVIGSVPFASVTGLLGVSDIVKDVALALLALLIYLTSILTELGEGEVGTWISIAWLFPYWVRGTTLFFNGSTTSRESHFVELQDSRLFLALRFLSGK